MIEESSWYRKREGGKRNGLDRGKQLVIAEMD